MHRSSARPLIVACLAAALAATAPFPGFGLAVAPRALCAADQAPTNVDQTLIADRDGYTQSDNPNNKGTYKQLRVGFDPGDGNAEYRIFLHFDLSTLRKQPVRCAILRLHSIGGHHGKEPKFIRIHPLYQDWVETEFTTAGPNKLENWFNPGGDFLPQACGGGPVPAGYSGDTLDKWYSFDITRCVQLWQNGTQPNDGLILMLDKGSDIWIDFDAREAGGTGRPCLLVSYGAPITVSDSSLNPGTGIPDFGPPAILNPQIMTKELRTAYVGTPFKQQLMVRGGAKPYKWQFMGLPPKGFEISANGLITGTPDKPFHGSFRVECAGADRRSSMATLKVTVEAGPPPGTIVNPGGPAGPGNLGGPGPGNLNPGTPAGGKNGGSTTPPKPAKPALPEDDG